MIDIDNISLRRGSSDILLGVTTSLPKPGVTSIIGPNGAGKSTLLNVIARLLRQDDGRVTVGGLDTQETDTRELSRNLAVLAQQNSSPARLSVHELVQFGRFPHSRRLRASDHDIVDASLEAVGVRDIAHRPIDELSGGQRQRAFLAMVLAQRTDYILLDEPLNNLDMRYAVQLMTLTRQLADEEGRAVVMVVHDVNIAAAFSDMLVAMKDGKIHTAGSVAEVMDEDVLSDLYDMDVRVVDAGGRPSLRYF